MLRANTLLTAETQRHREQLVLARLLNAIYLRFVYAGHIRMFFTIRDLFFSVSLCLCGEFFDFSFAAPEKSCC